MSDDDFEKDDEEQGSSLEETLVSVKIGKTSYACGLFWIEVTEIPNAVEEARNYALTPNSEFDYFCVRSDSTQFGVCKKSDGYHKGMVSLASALADSVEHRSWCGIFSVENGYYVISVREELIAEDQFYLNHDYAKQSFEDLAVSSDWSHIFAPSELEISGSTEVSIESLITSKGSKLQDVKKVSFLIKFLFVALIVAFGLFGVRYYYDLQAEEEQKAALANIQNLSKKNLSNQKDAVKPPPAPWEGKFKPASYLDACQKSMDQAVISVPGWRASKITCDMTTNVVMGLDRIKPLGQGGGTINWVRWALDNSPLKSARFSPSNPNGVDVTWNFGDVEKWKPDVGLTPKVNDIRKYIQSQFEEQFIPVQFGTIEVSDFFKVMKFHFDTNFPPNNFSDILSKVPGLFITKVSLDVERNIYGVDVQAAEQLPFDPNAKAGGKNAKNSRK